MWYSGSQVKNVLPTGRMDKLSQVLVMEQTRWGLRPDRWLDHVGVIGVLAMSGFSVVVRARIGLKFKREWKQRS